MPERVTPRAGAGASRLEAAAHEDLVLAGTDQVGEGGGLDEAVAGVEGACLAVEGRDAEPDVRLVVLAGDLLEPGEGEGAGAPGLGLGEDAQMLELGAEQPIALDDDGADGAVPDLDRADLRAVASFEKPADAVDRDGEAPPGVDFSNAYGEVVGCLSRHLVEGDLLTDGHGSLPPTRS